MEPDTDDPRALARALRKRFERAKAVRSAWESTWQDCYDFALPPRSAAAFSGAGGETSAGPGNRTDRLFDGTAPDAADQLAASLLARLTPPWSRWFGLAAGRDLAPEEQRLAGAELEAIAEMLQTHFDRSNFAVEIHQCYLDLVAAGTACLLFEEAAIGTDSAFRFTAIPLAEVWLEEGPEGRLDTVFRKTSLDGEAFRRRFPKAALDDDTVKRIEAGEEVKIEVLEAVFPAGAAGSHRYVALREGGAVPLGGDAAEEILADGRFARPPFIAFRWVKAPGEAYGRSPVMKTLPDIKTANKVVELILKNASIAVTGIWQAEDDGVLNPANIKLVPGTIIPKAVGSAGLTPLEAPGKFDVSELVLNDLRGRIRHALLADALGQIEAPKMTATEVLERSAEMARILGATYGRLQSELLTPLVQRGLAILKRRREIPDIVIDGRIVTLQYRSPLAQDQAKEDARNVVAWIDTLAKFGPEAAGVVDSGAAGRWLARVMGVPAELVRAPQSGMAGLPGLAGLGLPGTGLAGAGLAGAGMPGAPPSPPGAAPGGDLAALLKGAGAALPNLGTLLAGAGADPGTLGGLAAQLGIGPPALENKTGNMREAIDAG